MAAAIAADVGSRRTLPLLLPAVDPTFMNKLSPSDRTSHEMMTIQKLPGKVKRLLKLLEDPHSRSFLTRHVGAAKSVIKLGKRGIPLQSFDEFAYILSVLTTYDITQGTYKQIFIALVGCLRVPLVKIKSSDEERLFEKAVHAIDILGKLLDCCCDEEISIAVVESVAAMFGTELHANCTPLTDYQHVSSGFMIRVIERSTFCSHLSHWAGLLKGNERLRLLQAMKLLTTSSLTSDDVIISGGVSSLCHTISGCSVNDCLLSVSVDVLWNLLEYGSPIKLSDQFSTEESLSAICTSFYQHVIGANGQSSRQLRNELLVVAMLIASACPAAPFIETGFARLIILVSTYPEVRSNSPVTQRLRLHQHNHEDFEFKQLLFSTLLTLTDTCPTFAQVMSEGCVLLSLFTFVQPIDERLDTIWTTVQFEELQLQAVSTLCTLAPVLLDDYMNCLGNTRLLTFLTWCIDSDDYRGHGNSFHGVGGMGCKRAQMRHCLSVLRSVCSTRDKNLLQDLCDQAAIDILVGILSNVSECDDDNDAIDAAMQCDMMLILSCLCDENTHRKELFGDAGVLVLINYLKSSPQKFIDPRDHNELLLTTIDCVWSTILGCPLNETYFLQQEGIFLLLDFLEKCQENTKGLVLGAVLDLCENSKALAHVLTWRGKDALTVGKLLIDLWQNEEERIGVKRAASGMIADPSEPLVNNVQTSHNTAPLPSDCPSPAILDVSENIRAKIYSLFYKIGFNDVPGLKAVDYITLSIVERFVEFKTLEVWHEIVDELDKEGVVPVSPDGEIMEQIIFNLEERAAAVTAMQAMLVDTDRQESIEDEEEYYETIRESWKQAELSTANFQSLLHRTSNYEALKAAKQEQINDILTSRGNTTDNLSSSAVLHETTDLSLQTTTFCGRKINVSGFLPSQEQSPTSEDSEEHVTTRSEIMQLS